MQPTATHLQHHPRQLHDGKRQAICHDAVGARTLLPVVHDALGAHDWHACHEVLHACVRLFVCLCLGFRACCEQVATPGARLCEWACAAGT